MNIEPVRFGVIGVGGMGAAHANFLAQMEETHLVCVADIDEKSTRHVACETGAKVYADYRQLIDAGGIEAVVVATPHPFPPRHDGVCGATRHSCAVREAYRSFGSRADSMIEVCRASECFWALSFSNGRSLRAAP
jgi:hypothetical protein